MGDSASQPNAQSLRNLLVGLSRFEQFPVAIQWARENHLPHLHQPPHKGGWLQSYTVGKVYFYDFDRIGRYNV